MRKFENILTTDAFLEAITLPRAIVYFQVDWSGPERLSRLFVKRAIASLDVKMTPVFRIDCSNATGGFIESWFESQSKEIIGLLYGGWGETLLLSYGNILDFISYPAALGYENTRQKIEGWIN